MLKVIQRRQGLYGELWTTERDSEEWSWIFTVLPYLAHQDLGLMPGPHLQQSSDLELQTMPLYACKVPSVMLFPYITYFAGTWFDRTPSFIIPKKPLNRLEGRSWIRSLSKWPPELIAEPPEAAYLAWINSNNARLSEGIDYLEVIRLASAVQAYSLDEMRYIYDESKSVFDGTKSDIPSRHRFDEEIAQIEVTKAYIDWYIDQFNRLFTELIKIGRQDDKERRKLCMEAGWTLSRLIADAITILSTDAPFVRKWQFFGFLDAMASLINLLTKGKSNGDKGKVKEILQKPFLQSSLIPVLQQIPVSLVSEALITHTTSIYDSIDSMHLLIRGRTETFELSGPELLWAYRNSRHGFALRDEEQRKALLLHSGKIPDDLPDLVIALWHYILLKFPLL